MRLSAHKCRYVNGTLYVNAWCFCRAYVRESTGFSKTSTNHFVASEERKVAENAESYDFWVLNFQNFSCYACECHNCTYNLLRDAHTRITPMLKRLKKGGEMIICAPETFSGKMIPRGKILSEMPHPSKKEWIYFLLKLWTRAWNIKLWVYVRNWVTELEYSFAREIHARRFTESKL